MASKVLRCDPCSRLNKSTEAIKFCTDCDDALCTDCTTAHSALKITISHNVVDASVLTGRAFNLKKYCNDHQDMPFEFFCSDHDCLLCRSCIANTHRTCGKILPLDVAAKGIKSSVMFDDMSKDIAALRDSSKELVKDRQRNQKRVGQTTKFILQKITKFRKKINKHLDKLEKKLSADVEVMERELEQKASKGLIEAETRAKEIEYIWEQVKILTEHGSESQMLILLNAVRLEITKQSTNLKELMMSLETNGFDFENIDLISTISSIGSVKGTSSPCSVPYQPPKSMQAQMQQNRGNAPTRSVFEKKIDVPSGRITCIAVTDNGFIMCNDMLDNFKDNVIAYTKTGEKYKSCTVSNRVYGIAIIPNTEEAVVSLPEDKIIQFVKLSSMMTGRQLQVTIKDMFMYGIAVVRDTIIVSGSSGNVYFIEKMKGKCLKTFTIGTGSICSFLPIISTGSAAPFKSSTAPSLTNDLSAYTDDWSASADEWSASADDWSADPAATTRTTNWGGNSAEDWSGSADDWSFPPATKAHSTERYGSSAENWY